MVSHAHPTLQRVAGELPIKPAARRETRPSSEQSPHGELVEHRQPYTPPVTETKRATVSTDTNAKASSPNSQVADILKHAFCASAGHELLLRLRDQTRAFAGRLSNSERTLLTFRREPFSVALLWQDGSQ